MRQPSTIDLSQLPPPSLIEALDAESYVAAAIAEYRARFPDFDAILESEPVVKLIEVFAYRETLMRSRVNKTALATLLAYAQGSDLDHIAARFNVSRLIVSPEGAPVVHESDERLRYRTQLAPEHFSIAGPAGAYEYHALTVAPEIADAHAFRPEPGRVHVCVAMPGGAAVPGAVLARIMAFLSREDVVPLTDMVSVLSAAHVDYAIEATLVLRRGPDPLAVQAEAAARAQAYVTERYRIGSDVYVTGIVAALKAAGVENVLLAAPAADVLVPQNAIARLTGLNLAVQVP